VTFVGNTASDFGAGIGSNNAGAPTLTSVLLSGNQRAGVGQDCATGNGGAITSNGSNLSSDATCASFTQPSDKPNTAAGVSATLANNGGPTMTHALLAGSAAIDAGAVQGCPALDQRGFTRVGACDIGAFEFGGAAAPGPALLRGRVARPPRF
jgi:hypothetical protein